MSTAGLSPAGSSTYDSNTLHVGDGTWDSQRDTFLLPNLLGLNFATMRYNGNVLYPLWPRLKRQNFADFRDRHEQSIPGRCPLPQLDSGARRHCGHYLSLPCTCSYIHCTFRLDGTEVGDTLAYLDTDICGVVVHCNLDSGLVCGGAGKEFDESTSCYWGDYLYAPHVSGVVGSLGQEVGEGEDGVYGEQETDDTSMVRKGYGFAGVGAGAIGVDAVWFTRGVVYTLYALDGGLGAVVVSLHPQISTSCGRRRWRNRGQ
jgi:hypothetical protein